MRTSLVSQLSKYGRLRSLMSRQSQSRRPRGKTFYETYGLSAGIGSTLDVFGSPHNAVIYKDDGFLEDKVLMQSDSDVVIYLCTDKKHLATFVQDVQIEHQVIADAKANDSVKGSSSP